MLKSRNYIFYSILNFIMDQMLIPHLKSIRLATMIDESLINVVLSFSGEIFDLLPILSKVCFGLQDLRLAGDYFTQSENIKVKDFAHFNLFANIKIIKNIDLLCLSMSRSDCGIFSIFKDPGQVTASKNKSLLADPESLC